MAWRPHIRADGTYSFSSTSSTSSCLPSRRHLTPCLSLSRSDAHRNTTTRKTLGRLLYPPPGGTRVWSHTATETARLAFDDRFFARSMSRPTRSRLAGLGNERFELDSSNGENRTVIARLGLSLLSRIRGCSL